MNKKVLFGLFVFIVFGVMANASYEDNPLEEIIEMFSFQSQMAEESIDSKITSEYSPSRETHCDNGKCSTTLYSGIRKVYQNDTWINIEDSNRSLKEYFDIVYLEDDPNLEIVVKDFTYTSIEFDFKVKNSTELNKGIPVKVSGEEKTQLTFNDLSDVKNYKYELAKGDNVVSHNYTFGSASTTIQLQDADSENLEDVSGFTGGPQGALLNTKTWIKFNTSSIPAGQIIDSSQLCFIMSLVGASWDFDVVYYYIANQTWEETATATNLNALVEANSTLNTTFALATGLDCINTTIMVHESYKIGDVNTSIKLEDPDFDTDPNANDGADAIVLRLGERFNFECSDCNIEMRSKEFGTAADRPYLNVTYSELPPEGDTCSCSSIQAGTVIDCSENCDIEACDAEGQDINIIGSGKVSVVGDVTNYGKLHIEGDDASNKCVVTQHGAGFKGG